MKVVITDHAKERTEGDGRKRCTLPDSVLKNIVKRQKGQFFYDTKTEGVIQAYNRNVIVLAFDDPDTAVVKSVWRRSNPQAYYGSRDRFQQIRLNNYLETV